jgi:hypothetical protein
MLLLNFDKVSRFLPSNKEQGRQKKSALPLSSVFLILTICAVDQATFRYRGKLSGDVMSPLEITIMHLISTGVYK